MDELRNDYEEKFIILESKVGSLDPHKAVEFENIDRNLEDLTDEFGMMEQKINNAVASEDVDAKKLQEVHDATQRTIEEIEKKLDEYKTKADGYIAISEFREEKAKSKTYMEHIHPPTSQKSDDSVSDSKHKPSKLSPLDLKSVTNELHEHLEVLKNEDDVECKSDRGVSPTKLDMNPEEPALPKPRINNEEYKRDKLRKQVESMDLANLRSHLDQLKAKQVEVKNKEKKDKPKLTHELIRQTKSAYSVSRELMSKFKNIEDDFPTKIAELNTKIRNKLDIVEFESELNKLNDMMAALSKQNQNLANNANKRKNSNTNKIIRDNTRQNIGVVQPIDDPSHAMRKLIERHVDELEKRLNSHDKSLENLADEYSVQGTEIRTLMENLKIFAKQDQLKMLSKQIIILNDRIDGINGAPPITHLAPIQPTAIVKQEPKSPTKIVINNNADKLETEKSFRDVDRNIKKLRTDTFQKFDHTDDSITQFKKSVNKILERQDQSIISILTRVTSLEIRVDS